MRPTDIFRHNRKFYLTLSVMAASALNAAPVTAQDEPEVEEVVVTGSFIRNSAFAQNNPVDSVTAEDIETSGAPNISNYIRDLPYTQNTNTVANVNASNSGPQSSFGATFNLRGLGENSTLTLMDGVRSVDNGTSTLLPDIAIDRLEVVLDGGSALYGSDAVAGVVNMLPIKEFDGLRTRLYHQGDERGDFETNKVGLLWGRQFDNDLNWVMAGDYSRTTPLMTFERPRTLRSDYGWANSGNPGVWREVDGATPNPGEVHGGEQVGDNLRDPSCGAFNDVTDLGQKFNNVSGVPQPGGNCFFPYSQQWPLQEGQQEYNFYTNLQYDVSQELQLEAQLTHANREQENHNTLSYQLAANNRRVMVMPEDHPANPWDHDVGPHLWRPFAAAGTLPSYADPATGARKQSYDDTITRYKLGARMDLTDTWTSNTYYSYQRTFRDYQAHMVNVERMSAAMAGMGGPNGDQWYNPLGSADPRSPFYEEGVTSNSQELIDWMSPSPRFITSERELSMFEANATGDLYQLPAGAARMALGYQMRDINEWDYANPLSKTGLDYNTSITDTPPTDKNYGSKVHAAYMEFEVPILATLDAQLAVRHENFTTFGLDTTTPKVALRWEATPELAIRGSIGESFLAPTPADARPFDPNENCGEIFFGGDMITGGILNGGTTCSSGNPDLKPETSDIWNIGFTWEPNDDLSLSLDYQSIEYTDRIRTMNHLDMHAIEFESMLEAIGATPESYDPTPGSETREAAEEWLRQGGDPRVTRDPEDNFRVERIVRQAQNISSVWVDLLDARATHTLLTEDLGTFTTTLSATYYTKYDYQGNDDNIIEALGNQNARTGIVPPIPELKGQVRLGWFLDRHSASATVNYQHHVNFDDSVRNTLTNVPAPASGKVRSQAIVNGTYSYQMDQFLDSDITVSVGVNNLFDELPQRLPVLGGFESRLHSPWGRQFWASLEWRPGFGL
ncbi:MAG: TonB-dependent receptor domain-containing protein [Pseudomonadota bacterium]